MISLKYEWEHDYITAILETDNEKLPERLVAANATINTRIVEMDSGGTLEERQSLTTARAGLHKLRIERLGR